MKLTSWLIVESFHLPMRRYLLPRFFRLLELKRKDEAVKLMVEQIFWLEKLRQCQLDINTEQLEELIDFLQDNKEALLCRLNTIRLREQQPEVNQ